MTLENLSGVLAGKSTSGGPLKKESPLFGKVTLSDEESGMERIFRAEKKSLLWGLILHHLLLPTGYP